MHNLSLFLISLSAAPESASGGEHGGVSPFAGDFGSVLWTMIIFLAVLFVLNKFAWGPILSGLQGRERFIRDSLEQAKQQRDEAEARLKEYDAKLAEARTETEEILNEARRDAAALREREESRAKAEAEQLIDRAKREIQIAQDTAVKDLYSKAAGLATDAASRILQRELNPADHERLIEESISAIGQMGQN